MALSAVRLPFLEPASQDSPDADPPQARSRSELAQDTQSENVMPTVTPAPTQSASSVPDVYTSGGSTADNPPRRVTASSSQGASRVPVYSSYDFMQGYLENETYPILVDGKPWDNGSTNIVQYWQPGGGNSYWDYWNDGEAWDSPNHLWKDDQGTWHRYTKEVVQDGAGRKVTAYVLVDRPGPGVMDKLWFTHDATQAFLGVLSQGNTFWPTDPPEVTDWGNLARLGNLRIEVDDKRVFDGPIQLWFSGDAQQLTPALRSILVWRYGVFGSDGNIVPIGYQKHLKVLVYGGVNKPKWFMATGLTFSGELRVQAYTGASDLPLEQMNPAAQNVLHPESYLETRAHPQSYQLIVQPGAPLVLEFEGVGTVSALQVKVGKQYDPKQLWLKVQYGEEVGMDLPLLGFFSEPEQVSLHRSTPVGVVNAGDAYLFYSNWPMPYQNGMRIIFTTSGGPVPITVQLAAKATVYDTQLRAVYTPDQKLQMYGPDYQVHLDGDGKLVGLVLVTKDQQFDAIPQFKDKQTGKEDISRLAWPMGYLEGNLTLTDGTGEMRLYSGLEDWAEGGFYFNSGFTIPRGGSNRPFAGILRYAGGKDGYATLFRYFNDLSAFPFKGGLTLSFGHGTWENNFPVTYGSTVFYYWRVPGANAMRLPASDYVTVTQPQAKDTGP